MNKKTMEILDAITKYNDLHIDSKRLVIIESREIGYVSRKNADLIYHLKI